jgi:manganese/zinc/iron transport system substrate-binding protein
MTKRLLLAVALLALLLGALPAAAQTPEAPCSAPVINAVATIGMIADTVRNVGGACVNVTQMMGAGVDPHLYRATESDVFTLLEADVIFYGGLNLEARLTDVFEQMRAGGKATVAVEEAIPAEFILTEAGFNQPDPHVWMDVSLWGYVVDAISAELAALDPTNAEFYAASAAAYRTELEELHAYVQERIAEVPEAQRVLVTAHDAFQYFGHAYGIEVFAPQGITTATEAGVQDIQRTVDLIVEREIPAIFVEASVPPDVVEAIVAGAAAQGQTVVIGGTLFSDSMGETDTPEGTYIGMIRHNVDTIVGALLGETPQAQE